MSSPYPIGFVGHGAPTLGLEKEGPAVEAWRTWGKSLLERHGPPKGVLMLSAHWLDRATHFGPTRPSGLIYDFYGFPDELYHVAYAAPPAPDLGQRVKDLLHQAGLRAIESPTRGLDHGAWVPLLHLFPKADVPVLQVSLSTRVPMKEHLVLGAALAPLSAEGHFILGSGNITHNLRAVDFGNRYGDPWDWAKDFDEWAAGRLDALDLEGLALWQKEAPEPHRAQPTDDHFTPLLAALSAAKTAGLGTVRYPHQGFEYGTLSMRSVEFT
ncbi:MAG TPA: class III extradiol ring-cleavage dioxygenase [bacterium]|nr:class III extradiol ring-cleavage dioxygenase [bacterium]